jgi:hypothetical protein
VNSAQVNEAMTLFLIKCELVDLSLIVAGKTPVLVRTANSIFMPEIIYSSGLQQESAELVTALSLLSKGLDLVLSDKVIQN